MYTHVCEQCGNSFTSPRSTGKFCTDACRQAHYRATTGRARSIEYKGNTINIIHRNRGWWECWAGNITRTHGSTRAEAIGRAKEAIDIA